MKQNDSEDTSILTTNSIFKPTSSGSINGLLNTSVDKNTSIDRKLSEND